MIPKAYSIKEKINKIDFNFNKIKNTYPVKDTVKRGHCQKTV